MGAAHRRRSLAGARCRGPPRRHDRGVLPRVRRRSLAHRGGTGVRAARHGRSRGPDGDRASHRASPRARGAPARGLRQDDGDLRGAHRGRLDQPAGAPLLHGPAAVVLLPGLPAHGLRRARVGHPPGHRQGARPHRRGGRPADAVHVRALEVHRRLDRHRAVRRRDPDHQRSERRRHPHQRRAGWARLRTRRRLRPARGDRVRPRKLRPHRVRPEQRRHDPRQPLRGRPLPQRLLPDLRGRP